jgi:DNA-binding FadR family transcriptional regulator
VSAGVRARRRPIEIALVGSVVRPLKTAERFARDLVRDIIDRGMQPDDVLPPEAAMLEQYGVSRESLREGLRLLEVQGLINIRRGPAGGPVVGYVDPANLGRTASLYFHMSGCTYRELFEAWAVGEGILAERGARNPDAERRRATMRPFLGGLHPDMPDEELADYIAAHLTFHGALSSLADNRALALTLRVYGQIVSHHMAIDDDPRFLREQIVHDHADIARAVYDGRAKQAGSLMVHHIESIIAQVSAHLGDGVDDYVEWH